MKRLLLSVALVLGALFTQGQSLLGAQFTSLIKNRQRLILNILVDSVPCTSKYDSFDVPIFPSDTLCWVEASDVRNKQPFTFHNWKKGDTSYVDTANSMFRAESGVFKYCTYEAAYLELAMYYDTIPYDPRYKAQYKLWGTTTWHDLVYGDSIYVTPNGSQPACYIRTSWDSTIVTSNIGIEEYSLEVTAYPNPCTDELRFSGMPIKSVTILGSNGQVLITKQEDWVDVRHLPEGMYIYIVESNYGILMRNKFIKQGSR